MLLLAAPLAGLIPAPAGAAASRADPAPAWDMGFIWTYEADQEINYTLPIPGVGNLTLTHATVSTTYNVTGRGVHNGTQVHVLSVTQTGLVGGNATVFGFPVPVSGDVAGAGTEYDRVDDLAFVRSSFNTSVIFNTPQGPKGFIVNSTVEATPPRPLYGFPLDLSSTWPVSTLVSTTLTTEDPMGTKNSTSSASSVQGTARVPGLQGTTTPAGQFAAYNIYENGTVTTQSNTTAYNDTRYYNGTVKNTLNRSVLVANSTLTQWLKTYRLNRRPEVAQGAPPLVTLDEDSWDNGTLDLKAVFSDPDGDALAYFYNEGVNMSISVAQSTGAVSLRGKMDWSGWDNATFTARDPGGYTASWRAAFHVLPVNDAPVEAAPYEGVTCMEDNSTTVTVAGHFTDPDLPYGDALTFSGTSDGPVNITLGTDGNATLTPRADWNGPSNITVTAADRDGATANITFPLSVIPVEDAPRVNATVTRFTTSEETPVVLNLTLLFTDPDTANNDALTFSGTGSGNITVSVADTIATLSPGVNWTGEEVVVVRAEDRAKVAVPLNLTVAVTPVNDAPVIRAVTPPNATPVTVREGGTVNFTVTIHDSDSASFNQTWYLDGKEVRRGEGNFSAAFAYSPDYDAAGNHTLRFTAGDGQYTAEIGWRIAVQNTNRRPAIRTVTPANGTVVERGRSLALAAAADDPDGDALNFTWSLDGAVIGHGANLTVARAGWSAGNHTVQVVVSDGSDSATASLTVSVKAPKKQDGKPFIPDFTVPLLAAATALVVLLYRRGGR